MISIKMISIWGRGKPKSKMLLLQKKLYAESEGKFLILQETKERRKNIYN